MEPSSTAAPLGDVDAACYFISLDVECFDLAIAPGVAVPRFGGLTYFEVTNLLRGLASRGPVIGASLVGIVPAHDLHGLTSLLGAHHAEPSRCAGARGAVPFIFGGDHATTIPMMRAYEGRGPMCVCISMPISIGAMKSTASMTV